MLQSDKNIPTLGAFSKVVCDFLGLWGGDDKDLSFSIPAEEKERKKVLKQAFGEFEKEKGTRLSLDDLVSATTNMFPRDRVETKKLKTIQSYVNYLAKEDFSSYDEFLEFSRYIDVVVSERFLQKHLGNFSSKFYFASMMHYREFLREYAPKPEEQSYAYMFFVNNVMFELVSFLGNTALGNMNNSRLGSGSGRWPLRSFVDSVAELCDISLYKLHQYHEVQVNSRFCDKNLWGEDLIGQKINTRSKQVVDRLSKNGKIKWDTLCFVIKPFVYLLPEEIDEDAFFLKAYSAFLKHNIVNHISELDTSRESRVSTSKKWHYPFSQDESGCLPVSDRVDLLLNDDKLADEVGLDTLMGGYDSVIRNFRSASSSLLSGVEVPGEIFYAYNQTCTEFSLGSLLHGFVENPRWIDEWAVAKNAVLLGDKADALKHYKKALEEAKYLAGPLFLPLYVEICAFCKNQYKEFKRRNEEHLFDRFYEPLGSAAAEYARLIGYSPNFSRDPETLISA